MTNATSQQKITRNSSQKVSDEAPMVLTRLSGWIGSGGDRTPMAAWIIPTRMRGAQ